MARRRYGRRRHRGSHKIPIITLAILGGQALYANSQGGTVSDKIGRFAAMYTGFEFWSGRFHAPWLLYGYGPWLAKGVLTKFIFPFAGRPRLGKMFPVSLS